MKSKFPRKAPAKALSDELGGHTRKKKHDRESRVRIEGARHRARNAPDAQLRLEERPVAELQAPAINIRKLEEEHIAEVAESMAMFGNVVPLLVSGNEVVDGMIRLEAARRLGMETVPCIAVDHLNASEIKRLRIALNRLSEKGEYDIANFRLVLQEIRAEVPEIDIPGMTSAELEIILDDTGPEADSGDIVPDIRPDAPVARIGDIFCLGDHWLVCGDARDAASYAPLADAGLKARITATDFPYGCAIGGFATGKGAVKHREFVGASSGVDREVIAELMRSVIPRCCLHLIPGGLGFFFIDWRGVDIVVQIGRDCGGELINILVWNKGRGGMGGLYRNAHEFIPVLKFGDEPHLDRVKLGRYGRDRTNVLTYPGATTPGSSARAALADHPTPKSVELVADLIRDTADPGEIVLDPFMGSGTTIIAAEKTGRIAYGIELDPLYVDVAIRRWQALTGERATHTATGLSFDALEERRANEQAGSDEGERGTAACRGAGDPRADREGPHGPGEPLVI